MEYKIIFGGFSTVIQQPNTSMDQINGGYGGNGNNNNIPTIIYMVLSLIFETLHTEQALLKKQQ